METPTKPKDETRGVANGTARTPFGGDASAPSDSDEDKDERKDKCERQKEAYTADDEEARRRHKQRKRQRDDYRNGWHADRDCVSFDNKACWTCLRPAWMDLIRIGGAHYHVCQEEAAEVFRLRGLQLAQRSAERQRGDLSRALAEMEKTEDTVTKRSKHPPPSDIDALMRFRFRWTDGRHQTDTTRNRNVDVARSRLKEVERDIAARARAIALIPGHEPSRCIEPHVLDRTDEQLAFALAMVRRRIRKWKRELRSGNDPRAAEVLTRLREDKRLCVEEMRQAHDARQRKRRRVCARDGEDEGSVPDREHAPCLGNA